MSRVLKYDEFLLEAGSKEFGRTKRADLISTKDGVAPTYGTLQHLKGKTTEQSLEILKKIPEVKKFTSKKEFDNFIDKQDWFDFGPSNIKNDKEIHFDSGVLVAVWNKDEGYAISSDDVKKY